MTRSQRTEAVGRLLAFFEQHVGEVPEKARSDIGAWLKDGLTEAEIKGLIRQASADRSRVFSDDVLEAMKVLSRPLRRERRPESTERHLQVGRAA